MSIILNGNSSLDDLEEQASWQYAALSPTTIGYQVLILKNLKVSAGSMDHFLVKQNLRDLT
ncbi:hypothetical protein PsalMR5_02397 [Piscirickettsia salmonis]|nr:hypothetical protein PsalSR1_01714 [Piscirickettsia salmonis]QGP59821.1 hypothetical protein PsalBI1_02418 [Piscirickettsia salmonis]QGP64522.1 hypothetical protein PsalMR5_02397 [Piscirickettsia salmonis]